MASIPMLTAKSDPVDRVVGRKMGADDYVAKPFDPRELLARVRASLRRARSRGASEPSRRCAFEGLVIDLDGRRLETEAGKPIALTRAEFEPLACFVVRPQSGSANGIVPGRCGHHRKPLSSPAVAASRF
jgi:two-component system OmpR family response regulator